MRLAVATMASLLVVALQGARADNLTPVARWSGKVEDAEKVKARPEGQVITDQKVLTELWKAWRGSEEAPQIDFASYFIVVTTAEGRLASLMGLLVDGAGNALALSASSGPPGAKQDPKGFSYGIGIFPRAKVKTFGGNAIKGN